MSTKPTYEIDGSNFATLEGFFDEVGRVLIPEARWGHNLDAFNDILRGGFGTPESGGFKFKWKNAALSKERLGYQETTRQLRKRLERCHPENRDSVENQLKVAVQNRGPTVFDWLCEIIRAHGGEGSEAEDEVEFICLLSGSA